MDIKDLRCFCHVYEVQGINKAAKQLFITPQGLSKIIQNLEEEFQMPLFERTSKGMIPTESATYLFQHSQTLMHQMEDITIGMRKLKEKEHFEIGFSCGVLHLFPFHTLEVLRKQYPDVNISWNEDDNESVLEKLERNQLDAAFVIGNVSYQKFYSKEQYQKNLDVLVYEGHPFYERETLSIEDLEHTPLITMNEKFYSYHSFIQRCQDFGFVPNIVFKTMESQLIYHFCQEKVGLGIDVNIHHDIEHGLKRISLYDAIPWKVSLVVKRERMQEKIIHTMLELF